MRQWLKSASIHIKAKTAGPPSGNYWEREHLPTPRLRSSHRESELDLQVRKRHLRETFKKCEKASCISPG
jgi:hypothetical protein